jgi:hypothetical protein
MEELVRWRGTQFDVRVVDAVIELYHRGEFGVIRETEGMPLEITSTPVRRRPALPESVPV